MNICIQQISRLIIIWRSVGREVSVEMSVGVMGCKPCAKSIEGTSPAVKRSIQYLANARLYNGLKMKIWIRK